MATHNIPTFNDLKKIAHDMGENLGKAKDIQVQFAMKIIEASYLGAIDLDPNKHGPGRRDGVVLAEEYVKAQNSAVIFDHRAANQRKLISTLDKCIKLGSCPKWGTGQPLGIVNDLMTMRIQLKKAGHKVDDAFNTLMKFATKQLRSNSLFDQEQLRSFCLKTDPEAKSAEEVLDQIRKTANKLMAGKIAHCPDMDDSDEVKAIVRACTKRLVAIAKAKHPAPGAAPAQPSPADTQPQALAAFGTAGPALVPGVAPSAPFPGNASA